MKQNILLVVVIAILAAALFVLTATTQPQPTPRPAVSTQASKPTNHWLERVNAVRADVGVSPMHYSNSLERSAKRKVQDLAATNRWTHDNKDGSTFSTYFEDGWELRGENLARCWPTDEAAIDGLIESPGHYELMTDPDYDQFGAADVYDKDLGCTIVVHHFGNK